jgi:hypothetical protein
MKCDVCGSEENVKQKPSIIGAPFDVNYCSRCRHDELESWDALVAMVKIAGGFNYLDEKIFRLVPRTLVFHGKRKRDVISEIEFATDHMDG